MKHVGMVLAANLILCNAACAQKSPASDMPEKLTVADVLKGLILDESKLTYVDEPPGKLRAIECDAVLRDSSVRVHVRIDVAYTVELFSDSRKWDPKVVRAATVHKVTITPK